MLLLYFCREDCRSCKVELESGIYQDLDREAAGSLADPSPRFDVLDANPPFSEHKGTFVRPTSDSRTPLELRE